MAYENLREFLTDIENKGELRRIAAPVSSDLEITEIADRVVKAGGPTLLFENVDGGDIPVAIGLFGTRERTAMALGVEELDELSLAMQDLLDLTKTKAVSFMDKLSVLPKLAQLASFPPKMVKKAPVQEVVLTGDEVDLTKIPVLRTWPLDAGPFVTLPMVITKDPETGERNMGMYRMQVYDKNTTAMHWHRHKTGARHLEKAKQMGKKLEVAVALGGDPATIYSASAPLPDGIDEFLFAGFLRKKGVNLIKGKTVDLEVPAEAEIIIEGYIDPEEPWRREGPFGDHTGFYSLADDYPVLHVTAITRRQDAIYPATIVGKPIMEDFWLGQATERLFLPLFRMILPEVVDYHMPAAGVFHNLVFVSIDKKYPGHAFKVGSGMLGMGLMMLGKVIVVVDADVNVSDPEEVWWVALNNIDPERDARFMPGPLDVLDHASREFTYGTKMIIDGTKKWPEEGFTREWPEKINMSQEIKDLVDRRWQEYGI